MHYYVNTSFDYKIQARIWEQQEIIKFGMMKEGGKLLNLRNEIAQMWYLYEANETAQLYDSVPRKWISVLEDGGVIPCYNVINRMRFERIWNEAEKHPID